MGYGLLVLVILFSVGVSANPKGNATIESFNKAKKILQKQIYADHRITFYCGCPYDENNVIIPSDKYTPKKQNKRSNRIEWEHVVPAQAFGQAFVEWRDGDPECIDKKGKSFKGRNCASKMSQEFRTMEADMYNLVPAVGELNGLRSNYSYSDIPGEKREFGNCDFEIEDRKAEPRPEIRGDIARIYFYMDDAYPGRGIISKKNQKLFMAWDKEDPVDAWECERCRRIEKIQGNENHFVKNACLDANL